jgi:acetylornithine deacetylase/succinyl-diaminopimelate desuccinylase-like protein
LDRKNAKNQVLRYIENHKEDIIGWLGSYIAQRSEFPNELNAQRWVQNQFRKMEMFDDIDFWPADKKGKRPNVVGVIQGGNASLGKKLILNGHGDVVPVSEDQRERWSKPPWKPTIDRERIYGRGANDMKGGIASMVWAAKAIHDVGLNLANDLIVEVVVG